MPDHDPGSSCRVERFRIFAGKRFRDMGVVPNGKG